MKRVILANLILLSAVIFVGQVRGQDVAYEVDEHTIGLWHFDELSGNTAYDATSNDQHGLTDHATWYVGGKFDGSLSFDGTNDSLRIDLNQIGFISSAYTVEIWMNPSSLPSSEWSTIWSFYGSQQQMPLKLWPDGRVSYRIIENGFSYDEIYSTTQLQTGTWYHIACQYNGETAQLFVNGVEEGALALPYIPENLSYNVLDIGKMRRGSIGNPSHSNWFNGQLDELRISTIVRQGVVLQVNLDIKPKKCPNVIKIDDDDGDEEDGFADYGYDGAAAKRKCDDDDDDDKSIKVAVLGTVGFDVNSISVATILLAGVEPSQRWKIKDKSTPVNDTAACACSDEGKDGFVDLILKFRQSELLAAIGPVNDGDEIELTLMGELNDGTPFEGSDCVVIYFDDDDDGDKSRVAKDHGLPVSFVLAQNYPNPFNPATNLSFNLPHNSDYELTIFNVNGQKVRTFTGNANAGTVELTWDASDNASGIYFYKLTAGNFTATKKMVLLK